jgi:phosphohistidine phosphatase
MLVYIVRHAIAEDRELFKKRTSRSTGKPLPDTLRPLTKEGKREFKKIARSIRALSGSIDLIATSPLKRARQTADLLKKRYLKSREIVIDELKPGKRPAELLNWLRGARLGQVMLVGHEPSLGIHVTYFLTGARQSACDIKKGGVVVIEFAGRIEKGAAKLVCCLQPVHLKKLVRVKKKK